MPINPALFVPSGGQASMILLACILMCLDVVSGFIAALIRHEPSSARMREGLGHKALLLLIIAASFAVEKLAVAGGMPVDLPATVCVCGYITVMEFMSVLENVAKGSPEFKESKLYRIIKGEKEEGKDEDK